MLLRRSVRALGLSMVASPAPPASRGVVTVCNKFTKTVLRELPETTPLEAEAAMSTAHALFRDRGSWLPKHERIEILKRTAALITDRRQDLALQAAQEGGKPLIDSLVEIDRAADGVENCAEILRSEAGSVVPMKINAASTNRMAFTQLEPIGPVVAVSAFNHPFNLIVHQACPAIAVGCPVVVKPSDLTPLSCLAFAEIMYEAGLPRDWLQVVVTKDNAVSGSLVSDPRAAFFSFIGSARVGWMLRSTLAPGTRCALEHGGVAPVIVAEDADLDSCVPLLAKGGFYHAGQVCVSVQRVFAHESIARDVADRLAGLAVELNVGDPTDAATEVGPLIRDTEVERVHSWVREAVDEGGATVLCGGESIGASCYSPTVLWNPSQDVQVSTAEVFGPVVCVYPYSDIDEAIAVANSLPVSFQAGVMTRSIDTALRVYRKIDATAVMVNDHTAFRTDWMPFAGARTSGHGVGGIPYTMHEMQTEKMMVVRSGEIV